MKGKKKQLAHENSLPVFMSSKMRAQTERQRANPLSLCMLCAGF